MSHDHNIVQGCDVLPTEWVSEVTAMSEHERVAVRRRLIQYLEFIAALKTQPLLRPPPSPQQN